MRDKKELLLDLVENPISRRSFAKRIGMIGAGIAGASMLSGTLVNAVAQATNGTDATLAAGLSDVDILNFALNLEYLEGEFYTYGTYGESLVQAGVIPANAVSGPTTGGHMVPNLGSSPRAYIYTQIRKDEQGHVKFLRSALGSAAVKKPTINLNALGFGFAKWQDFLKLAAIFEDVGTSAYNGAAPLIQNKTYLAAAAGIYGVEAQHSGALRTHAIDEGIRIPNADGKSVPPLPSSPFFVRNSLTPARSAQEVLHIVYGGKNTPGGFFPDGLNGKIR